MPASGVAQGGGKNRGIAGAEWWQRGVDTAQERVDRVGVSVISLPEAMFWPSVVIGR